MVELLAAGDSNVDLAAPEGNTWDEDIAAALDTVGVKDMSSHLLPCRNTWLREGRTWSMLRS